MIKQEKERDREKRVIDWEQERDRELESEIGEKRTEIREGERGYMEEIGVGEEREKKKEENEEAGEDTGRKGERRRTTS